ncbi:exodeoxyribonuclease V subunit gamma [Enterobacter cloacae]|nr:exodeoxyribonuclease V subunit gamma [Enterobacter cloacae]
MPLFKDSENAAQLFDEEGIQNLPNPLLASWGKLGRDYIYLLSDITSSGEGDVDAFADITRYSGFREPCRCRDHCRGVCAKR